MNTSASASSWESIEAPPRARAFRATLPRVRIFAGEGALGHLRKVVVEASCRRVMVLSGQSVARGTPLISTITSALGEGCAGTFDRIGRNATRGSLEEAVSLARSVSCDGIVAVGAGTAMVFGRLLAILMAEGRPAEEICTRYRDGAPPETRRLPAAKVPIFNVLTAPTNAQGRGGSALVDPEQGRLEFFDPKTRPTALFWDPEALMTAPLSLTCSNARTTYFWALMGMASAARANPLVEGVRRQAYMLARSARGAEHLAQARIDLCAAAWLHNSDEDLGGAPFVAHWIVRVCYAIGAGLATLSDQVRLGDIYNSIVPHAMRHLEPLCRSEIMRMAETIAGRTVADCEAARGIIRADLTASGPLVRLRDVLTEEGQLDAVLASAMRAYNADPNGEFKTRAAELHAILRDAW
ncbi:iron-containing alcohol dehydrogenase [Bradyrhizobium sp. Tv2a-2]|uniref:iron-containing alcohol dehydrogenase n=1 Tax=Bradyrhizobium sp. Tv2a-2 TaxID=113395 RepID=UPI0003FA6AED|nr:iron-containing alcohol dehydrogenase [Bradyrhizobium sp. Tv2a-2]